jgi:hypothetical protein
MELHGGGRGWRSPRRPRCSALVRLARPHVLGDLDVLAHPKGEVAYQRSYFGAPEVSPERAVVALVEHLRQQSATGGDAESVSLALPAALQQAAAHQERPALLSVGGGGEGCAARSTSVPSAAAAPRMKGQKTASTASSAAKDWTNVCERKRSSEGIGGDGAVVVPVPSGSTAPASARNIGHGGGSAPPLGDTEGRASPAWTASVNVAAAACRLASHHARTAASRAGTAARGRRGPAPRRAPAGSPHWHHPSMGQGSCHPQTHGAKAGPSGCVTPAGGSRRSGSPQFRRASGRTSCSGAGMS